MRDIDLASRQHPLFSFLLLLAQFHLSRDVASVQISRDVFAHGRLATRRNDSPVRFRLDLEG